MKDWIFAGLIYVPAFLLGQWAADHQTIFAPFLCGWIVGGSAVLIRMHLKVATGSLVVKQNQ